MKKIIFACVFVSVCFLALARAGVVERVQYATWLECGVAVSPGKDFLLNQHDDKSYSYAVWNVPGCTPPAMTNLPNNAESVSFVATSDVFRAEGVATDTNTIREVRQDLKALKLSLTNIVININTNPAFNNAQGKILKEMVNAMEADIKANLKLLRDGQ